MRLSAAVVLDWAFVLLATASVNACANVNRTSSTRLGDESVNGFGLDAAPSDSSAQALLPVPEAGGGAPKATLSPSAERVGPTPANAVDSAPRLYATLPYRGVSMSGAEFGASFGGLFNGTDLGSMPGGYYYPTSDLAEGGPHWPKSHGATAIETDRMNPYFLGKGMNTIRLPLRWERLQHSLSKTSSKALTGPEVVATFDGTELAALKSSVSALTGAGFVVLIDIHNYAWYTNASEIASSKGGDPVGSANVPDIAFENLWIGLASMYRNDPRVVFDIMNEPNTPPDPPGKPAGYEWYLAAQAAVTGIRSVGANNLILVPGNQFSGPGAFTAGGWSDPLKDIHDPGNNFAFEVHDYPDTKFGTSNTCTTGAGGSIQSVLDALQTFVTWAKKYKGRGFLGEFSAGTDINADANCEDAIGQMLTLLTRNSNVFIGWTYWAAGAGFGPDAPMNYPLFNAGRDSPQMQRLAPFLEPPASASR